MAKPTVGLCVIAPTYGAAKQAIDLIKDFVDEVYLQENQEELIPSRVPGVKAFYYKWNDNFADARNALLKEVKTDYWLWMDSDDIIDHPERIREAVTHMEDNAVDILYAPYLYDFNEDGSPKEVQNRERIIRTSVKGQWRGRVHETFIPDQAVNTENTELITWVHKKTREEHNASTIRNRELMLKAFNEDLINGKKDPRYAYYLGLNYTQTGEYEEARKYHRYLIEHGGWDEERYRAWLQIASTYQREDNAGEAITAALQATLELPEWPDAYYLLQQLYYEADDHLKALEWYKVGVSKPTPESDSAFSPILRYMQPHLLAAFSYLFTGDIDHAVAEVRYLKKSYPNYQETDKIVGEIDRAYHEQQAIKAAKTLIQFNKRYEGDAKMVLDTLPSTLRADIRLTDERRELILGRKWDKGSIVFYCGQSYEPWGPETLNQGMGGSEEAVIYLTRELFKGFGDESKDTPVPRIVVYNEREERYTDVDESIAAGGDGPNVYLVPYRPWTEINPSDEFDTFVAWRDPSVLQHIKAKTKLCDLHDIIDPDIVYRNAPWVDKYLFKTKFHRNLYPELSDDKCAIIGNGIVTEQFK